MDFWYVKIEKIIGKVLFCHFFDNYGNSKRKKVWSMRLLKKKLATLSNGDNNKDTDKKTSQKNGKNKENKPLGTLSINTERNQ